MEGYKAEGNEAYKRGKWQEAMQLYTKGVEEGLSEVATGHNGAAGRAGTSGALPLARLYSNRAAAALKLYKYEQVIHDSSRAMRLLHCQGSSCVDLKFVDNELYKKCCLRRASALKVIGNLAAAAADLMLVRKYFECNVAFNEAVALGLAHTYPTPWGGYLPPVPHKRSTVAVEWAEAQTLRSRVPPTTVFAATVTWEGRIYILGGRTTDLPAVLSMKLTVLDPRTDTVAVEEVGEDPETNSAPRPRSTHSLVEHEGSLYMYGGDTIVFTPTQDDVRYLASDARTVWRLDLTTRPLQWQRLRARRGALAPPEARGSHTAVVHEHCMIVYGGMEVVGGELGDVWQFDLRQRCWSQLAPAPQPRRPGVLPTGPEPRKLHVAWVHAGAMYVYGGARNTNPSTPAFAICGQDSSFGGLWRFKIAEREWELLEPTCNAPCPRSEACVATTPQGVAYICGGYSTAIVSLRGPPPPGEAPRPFGQAYLNDVWAYFPNANAWRVVRTADMQGPLGRVRASAAAAWLDNTLYVAGGYIGLDVSKALTDVRAVRVKACSACGKPGREAKLRQCERCKGLGKPAQYYCSRECQQRDWPVHEVVCSSSRGILR